MASNVITKFHMASPPTCHFSQKKGAKLPSNDNGEQ